MNVDHPNRKSLDEVNKAFDLDKIISIDKFIEIVLRNRAHSREIGVLIKNTLEKIRKTSEFSHKHIVFEPLHLIVDP
jgi:hypothetical protein